MTTLILGLAACSNAGPAQEQPFRKPVAHLSDPRLPFTTAYPRSWTERCCAPRNSDPGEVAYLSLVPPNQTEPPTGIFRFAVGIEVLSLGDGEFSGYLQGQVGSGGGLITTKDSTATATGTKVDRSPAYVIEKHVGPEMDPECGGCVLRDYYIDWADGLAIHAMISSENQALWDRFAPAAKSVIESLRHR